MFRGTHFLNLDAKGRLAIPASQRALLAEHCESRIVVTADPQRCLIVYPEPRFVEVESQLNSMPTFQETTRHLQRLIVGYANPATLDAQGRVLLTPSQRAYAGLSKEVVLVGVGNRYELWDHQAWQQILTEVEQIDLSALALDPATANFSL